MRRDVSLTLSVNGFTLTGNMIIDGETAEILDGTVNGEEISFAIASGADDVPVFEFHGCLAGDALTLTVSGRMKATGETLKIGAGSFRRIK